MNGICQKRFVTPNVKKKKSFDTLSTGGVGDIFQSLKPIYSFTEKKMLPAGAQIDVKTVNAPC